MPIQIHVGNRPASQFGDFLVGTGQSPISVSIRTAPQAAGVMWAIKPSNKYSGAVDPSAGPSKELNFTPDATAARAKLRTGSRTPNVPVGYIISVVMASNGRPESTLEQILQDEKSILRQEYVDFATQPLPANMVGQPPDPPARSALMLHLGPFNTGNYQYVANLADMQARFNNIVSSYRGQPVTVNGQVVQIPQTAGVTLASAYRNPQRNRAIGSVHLNSLHVLGRALDLIPATPVTVQVAGHPVHLGIHAHLFPALAAAAATQGTAIAETNATNQVAIGNSDENHIHVQW
jgi:hypothetical protein